MYLLLVGQTIQTESKTHIPDIRAHTNTNKHTHTHDAERSDAFSKDLTSMTWLVTILSPVKKWVCVRVNCERRARVTWQSWSQHGASYSSNFQDKLVKEWKEENNKVQKGSLDASPWVMGNWYEEDSLTFCISLYIHRGTSCPFLLKIEEPPLSPDERGTSFS